MLFVKVLKSTRAEEGAGIEGIYLKKREKRDLGSQEIYAVRAMVYQEEIQIVADAFYFCSLNFTT